jgi:hypothetical protein
VPAKDRGESHRPLVPEIQVPALRTLLRFTALTNTLGMAGSAAFMFGGVYFAMRGPSALATPLFAAAVVAWLALTTSSYLLRSVEREGPR